MYLPSVVPNNLAFTPVLSGGSIGIPPIVPNNGLFTQAGGNNIPLLGHVVSDKEDPVEECPECACSHERQGLDNKLTCYTNDELKKLAKKKGINTADMDEEKTVKTLQKVNEPKCGNDQTCWAGDDEELVQKAFKPVVPDGKFTWLNTTNIQHVMEQFENKYPDFKYLGTVAIDFEDYHDDFKNFEMSKYLNLKKKRFGAVFNTDKHYQSGQHWIAFFVDADKGEINFFDSYGKARPVPPEVDHFAERLVEQGKNHGIDFKYSQNKTVMQKKNSECGVYSMYFLKKRLDGVPFEKFTKNPISDDKVQKYRVQKGWESFFRPEEVPSGVSI
jgi:peptide methionine sulfoxide reductase MsrB